MNRREFFRKMVEASLYLAASSIGLDKCSFETNYNDCPYNANKNKYRRWVEKVSEESYKKGDYSVIVDKIGHNLIVLKNGEYNKHFPVDLSSDFMYDKKREGDNRTPEGIYYSVWNRDKGKTMFYRAYLLNYPNIWDILKGKTGSNIEIHGYGGTGKDWTLGCIAVPNKGMDYLFENNVVKERKTPIAIVKCLIPCEGFMEKFIKDIKAPDDLKDDLMKNYLKLMESNGIFIEI